MLYKMIGVYPLIKAEEQKIAILDNLAFNNACFLL